MTSGKRATAPYGPAKTRPFRFGTRSPASGSGDDRPLAIGAIVDGRYEITGLLGEGGMGRVFAAEHRILGRRVALKVLHSDAQTSGDNLARFHQEALLTTRIGHPGIVEVLDCATLPDGRAFMVMEFLEGQTLEDAIATPGPAAPRLTWLAKISEALAAAHRVGVVHRDIKPANLFLVAGPGGVQTPKILDFGIAKAKDASGIQTQAGALLGTPYYLAPERALSAPLDARADLYSLGVILYELLTGDVPFVGATMMEVIGHHIHSAPLDPRQAAPDRPIPAAVAELTMELLAKDPADRPADGDLVAARLGQLLRDHSGALATLVTGPREFSPGSEGTTLSPTAPSIATLPPTGSGSAAIDRGAATVPPVSAADALIDRGSATAPPVGAARFPIDRGAATVPPVSHADVPIDRSAATVPPVGAEPLPAVGRTPAHAAATLPPPQELPARRRLLIPALIILAIAIAIVITLVALLPAPGTPTTPQGSTRQAEAAAAAAPPAPIDPSLEGTTTQASSASTSQDTDPSTSTSTSTAPATPPTANPNKDPRPSKKTKTKKTTKKTVKKGPTTPAKTTAGPPAGNDGLTLKTDVYDD